MNLTRNVGTENTHTPLSLPGQALPCWLVLLQVSDIWPWKASHVFSPENKKILEAISIIIAKFHKLWDFLNFYQIEDICWKKRKLSNYLYWKHTRKTHKTHMSEVVPSSMDKGKSCGTSLNLLSVCLRVPSHDFALHFSSNHFFEFDLLCKAVSSWSTTTLALIAILFTWY